MELDLYQRRGMYGLGVVDPVTGLDSSAGLTLAAPTPIDMTAPASTNFLSSMTGGLDLSSMSPTTLLIAGAVGLWMLNSIFSGTKRAYGKVAAPIKRHRKRKAALSDAEEDYRRKRKRIQEGKY